MNGMKRIPIRDLKRIFSPKNFLSPSSRNVTNAYRHLNAKMFVTSIHSSSKVASEPRDDHKELVRIIRKEMDRFQLTRADISKAIKNSPEILNYGMFNWQKCFKLLSSKGLSSEKIMEMISVYPELLSLSQDQMENAWNAWYDEVTVGDTVVDLIETCPWFLSAKKKDITAKFRQVKAVVGGRKFTCQVLKKCPNIMMRRIEELESVSDYLSVTMKVKSAAEYYKSTALGCSLVEVMTRHVFLERCGKYKPPNLKHSEHIPTGNPSLSEIYDTSPHVFATEVAGVTSEEYAVFQDLFHKQLSEQADDISGSDDDSDDDSGDDSDDNSDDDSVNGRRLR